MESFSFIRPNPPALPKVVNLASFEAPFAKRCLPRIADINKSQILTLRMDPTAPLLNHVVCALGVYLERAWDGSLSSVPPLKRGRRSIVVDSSQPSNAAGGKGGGRCPLSRNCQSRKCSSATIDLRCAGRTDVHGQASGRGFLVALLILVFDLHQ